MLEKEDKRHWYDGKLYNYLIDPNTGDTRKIISSLIEKNSKIIDIGCGTGSLAFHLSEKGSNILGIELSKRMVEYANSAKEGKNIPNVKFIYGNAEKVSELTNERFDYAIFSLSLHEMKSETRHKILEEIKKVSDKIIVYDYLVRQSFSIQGASNSIIEFLAGREHYRNYKSFLEENGVYGILEKNGFKIEKTIIDKGHYVCVKAKCK